MTKRKPPAATRLRAEGQQLWDRITGWEPNGDGERMILRPDELALLRNACHCADVLDDLRRVADGLSPIVFSTSGAATVSPVITEIRAQEKHLMTMLRVLRIPDGEADADGGWDNLSASQRARKASIARWAK